MNYSNFLLIYNLSVFVAIFLIIYIFFKEQLTGEGFKKFTSAFFTAVLLSTFINVFSYPKVTDFIYLKTNKDAYVRVETEKFKIVDKYTKTVRFKKRNGTAYYFMLEGNSFEGVRVKQEVWNKKEIGDYAEVKTKKIYNSKELANETVEIN